MKHIATITTEHPGMAADDFLGDLLAKPEQIIAILKGGAEDDDDDDDDDAE